VNGAVRSLAHVCAGVVGALTVCAVPTPVRADDTVPNAAEIFARARTVWRARAVPRYIRYTTAVQMRVNRKVTVERDDVLLRSRDRVAFVRTFRSGDSTERGEVTIKTLRLAPNSTFGLAPKAAGEDESPFGQPSPETTSPPQIGHVVATTKPLYDVALIGSELVDGHPCWHLALKPAAGRNGPLRNVWVDRETSDIRKLDGVTDVHKGPFHRLVPFDAEFAESGGFWLISHAHVAGGVRLAFFRYTGEGEMLFSGYTFPADAPDYCFDRALYDAHGEGAPCTTP
jgi:hypothetical protein